MILSVDKISKELIESIDTLARNPGNQSTKDTKWRYKDVICAFDIETSLIKIGSRSVVSYKKNVITGKRTRILREEPKYISIMYIWQFQIGVNITIIGRKWNEFVKLMDIINISLKDKERLLVFVHNLSYEFQWLRDKEILGKHIIEDSVFMLSARKILKFLCYDNKIEFRCSYIHSNMSLALFTNKMNVEHKKLSGEEYNYNEHRYPWTKLTERQLEYCVNDVLGLVEAIYKEMEIDGDNAYTYPLTSTGYVRRDIRKAIHDNLPRNYISDLKPDYKIYTLLHDAFRGGNTHANRFMADKTITGNIIEYDRSSSYPDVQMNGYFPTGKFHKPRTFEQEGFLKCIERGYCVICRLRFEDIELRDELIPVPYISIDKCTKLEKNSYVSDNGRILKAKCLEIALTEIDLDILLKQYKFSNYTIIEYYFAHRGQLPDCIKDVIREYYIKKTALKGVEGQEILYMKSKNKLNSIYGNSAQNPGKLSIIYDNGEYKPGYIYKKEKRILDTNKEGDELKKEYQELLQYIYDKTDTVLPYQWGVWTTSASRKELQKMIDICGDNFIYCDTDSVYFVADKKINFDEYNKEKIKLSTESKAFAEDKNKKLHYMGVAECERNDIIQFRTMGAKKYAYLTKDGKLKITISGVSTKYSVHEVLRSWAENADIDDKIEDFSPLDILDIGYTFYKAGGNEIQYNDESITCFMGMYIPTNACIVPSTYELGLNEDYYNLIKNNLSHAIRIFYNTNLGIPIDISALL